MTDPCWSAAAGRGGQNKHQDLHLHPLSRQSAERLHSVLIRDGCSERRGAETRAGEAELGVGQE